MLSLDFIAVHFVLCGIIMARGTRHIATKYLQRAAKTKVNKRQKHSVEPMYAFDIHCNGFFPAVIFAYLGNVSSTFFD